MLIIDQLKKSDRRLQTISIGVLVGLGILLSGLWYVQVLSANRYRDNLKNQSIRIVRLPAIRGKILDRNGVPLADNRPSFNVNLYLEDLRPLFTHEYTNRLKKEYLARHPGSKLTVAIRHALEQTARYCVVSNLFFQVSSSIQEPQLLVEKEFNRYYQTLRSLPFPLLKDLTPAQVAAFVEKAGNLPSLALEVQPLRVYPYKRTAAHLLGHLKRVDAPLDDEEINFQFRLPDFVGSMGLEAEFDQALRGRPGVKSVLVNSMQYRQSEQIWTAAEPGENLVLTLDIEVQQAADRALNGAGAQVRGAAVVMDCQNGEILAMASAPSFDPNEFLLGISQEEWEKLKDEKLRPLFNRAAYGIYMPGSIFKIIVALACLEEGKLDPAEIYHSKGYYQLGRRTIDDTAGAGDFDFRKAFLLSSNPYFIEHGLRVGPEGIIAMGRRFGLGERTGLSTGESAGYFPQAGAKAKRDGSTWLKGDTANLSIGQGEVAVTLLQMAVMTAAIANGGKLTTPRLIDRCESANPSSAPQRKVPAVPPGRGELKVSARHLDLLRQAMLADVEDPGGTGRRAAMAGMRVAGKTGTAQVMHGRSLREYVAWFVSFAPYEHPQYVVVVVVEGGISGSVTCAPVAREIYQALGKRKDPSKSTSLVDVN